MGTTELIVEPGRQDVVVVHDFEAPPEVAFRAYTDPELMPRWRGSERFSVVVDEPGFSDADGGSYDPQELGFPAGIPRVVPHVVTVRDGLMTIVERGYADAQTAELSRQGLESSLDKLAATF